MRQRREKFNPKRHIAPSCSDAVRGALPRLISYSGSAAHKGRPGDFGLTPPAAPRFGATLCDGIVEQCAEAQRLLKMGAERGLISEQLRNGWPQNIWAVTPTGVPLEAQLENEETGAYYGYPMGHADPFRSVVLEAWNSRK